MGLHQPYRPRKRVRSGGRVLKDPRNTRWPPQVVGAGPMLGAAVTSGPVRDIGMGLVTTVAWRAEMRRRRAVLACAPALSERSRRGGGATKNAGGRLTRRRGTHINAVGGPSGCGRGGQQRVALGARQRLASGGPVAVEADTDLSSEAANPSHLRFALSLRAVTCQKLVISLSCCLRRSEIVGRPWLCEPA